MRNRFPLSEEEIPEAFREQFLDLQMNVGLV